MLKACIHSNCAVCKQVKDRDLFKVILQEMYPDVYLCEHAMYKILCNSEKNFIIIPSLGEISCTNKGYLIKDIFTGVPIYLNSDNFEVICSKEGKCGITEPYVAEYIPKSKKAAD